MKEEESARAGKRKERTGKRDTIGFGVLRMGMRGHGAQSPRSIIDSQERTVILTDLRDLIKINFLH